MILSRPALSLRSILLCFLCALAASCGPRERESDRAADAGILLIGNATEPKGLDPHLVTGVPENQIIGSLLEGLIAYHPTDDLAEEPGVAESWSANGDFTVWTFKLRDNARWTNGDPVTAEDFVYSWQRMLSPQLGAEYAEMLYVVKKAEAFHKGEIRDFGQVGVTALDSRTLRVELEGPTPHFPLMLKHYSFFPVNPRVVERYGGMTDRQSGWSTLEHYVGNGAFRLKAWDTNKVIEVVRNPGYWDAGRVRLNAIRFYPIDNVATEETMYRNGRLHLTNSVNPDKIPFFRRTLPDELTITPYLGVYYYEVNVTRKPFNDPRIRRALALAIDRKLLVERVTQGGQAPASGFVPQGIAGYASSTAIQFAPDEARALLSEAGYPGGRGFPKAEILINTSESHRKIAQAIQAMWKKELGIEVGIYNQEWKVYLDSRTQLNYDIARAAWIGDYVYPMTFLDLFTTGNGNNRSGWGSPQFDAYIEQARVAGTDRQRMALMRKAEGVLLDELPVIPLYWYTRVALKDPRLRGWDPKLLDNHPYKYVWFAPRDTLENPDISAGKK